MNLLDVLIGAAFAAIIALLAWRAGALTRGGAVAAFVVGTLTYASGTIGFTLVLLAFFVPSVLLSRFGRARKRALVDVGKHGARDALQVLANGGVATACALAWAFTSDLRWVFAMAGAYAAATADTWATELGTLVRQQPRSILTLRPVATGLSGGVTLIGTLAEVAGAIWIGVVALAASSFVFGDPGSGIAAADAGIRYVRLIVTPQGWSVLSPLIPIAVGGIAGATFDSILGASVQELRYCDRCERTCETDPHACGSPTRLIRGVRRFSNDLVNLLATAAGAAVAFAVA